MLLPATASRDITGAVAHFREHGFASLGQVLTDEGAAALAARADALMTGESAHPGVFYQHDSPSGRYEDLDFSAGWVGPSSRYRKLEKLEADLHFAAFIENEFFARVTRELLGGEALLYRSVLWNKAAGGGMAVPWHQDDGRFWGLDRPPFLQVWTALDEAPAEAGCLEVVPGTHHDGLATPEGGTIPDELIRAAGAETRGALLPARRGVMPESRSRHRAARKPIISSHYAAAAHAEPTEAAADTMESWRFDQNGPASQARSPFPSLRDHAQPGVVRASWSTTTPGTGPVATAALHLGAR